MKPPVDAKTGLLQAVNITVERNAETGRRIVLDRISLAADRGEIVHVQGPSGTGKSTLLWALARMLPLDSGEIYLEGREAGAWPAPSWRARVALVVQTHAMVPGTVGRNLLLPWTLKIRSRSDGAPRALPPDESRLRRELDALCQGDVSLETDASRLSVGQTARVSLLRSLLTAPDCLLLDEPCAALDPDAADRVMARIREFVTDGRAALVVGHGSVDPLGRVVRLESGRLSEGDR